MERRPAQGGHSGGADAPAGPQRSWLLRQMELDTAFLRDLNLLDYSLLMAAQQLQEDERGPGGCLLFRSARWAPGTARMGDGGGRDRQAVGEEGAEQART